jgi:hypothetical protein
MNITDNTDKKIEISCKYSIQKMTKKKQKRSVVDKWKIIDTRDNSTNSVINEHISYDETINTNVYNLVLTDNIIDNTERNTERNNENEDLCNDTLNVSEYYIKYKNKKNIQDLFNNPLLQFNILSELYLDFEIENNKNIRTLYSILKEKKKENSYQYKIILQEINKKISGYKNQDIIKKRYNKDIFISLYKCIELLIKHKLKCNYCNKNVKIIYQYIRESYQWSLDRINNDTGHNENNCILSCLKCNLQRKRLNDKKFLFTKRMNVMLTE